MPEDRPARVLQAELSHPELSLAREMNLGDCVEDTQKQDSNRRGRTSYLSPTVYSQQDHPAPAPGRLEAALPWEGLLKVVQTVLVLQGP